jgi:DNA-binding MarR family transcriptional regulator
MSTRTERVARADEAGTGSEAEVGIPAGVRLDGAVDPQTEVSAEVAATRVWRNLRALVLDQNERRKETCEALGMSFFRVKALRRIAAEPSRMSELADRLSSDRPYLTLVVDDLEKRGLVERRRHPADRRCKIVSATPAGQEAAARANTILGTLPPALLTLSPADLAALDRIAAVLTAAEPATEG